jgi:NAD+ kinase
MKINVVYNRIIPNYKNTLDVIVKTLEDKGVEFKAFDLSEMVNFGEFTFVIGGDGTLLRAARFYAKTSVPVLGINLGRLGFLSQADSKEFHKVVDAVLSREFYTEDRLMVSSGDLVALNDFVIKGSVIIMEYYKFKIS